MADNEDLFTFVWNIKNFSFSFYPKILRSPTFSVSALDGTEWNLILNNIKDNMCCRIQRLNDAGPNEIELDYELSFLGGDQYVLRSEMFVKKDYKKGHTDSQATLSAPKDEILTRNKDLFIPGDILTIRCRMWDSKKPFSKSDWRFAETLIETECRSFVGTVEKFRSVESSCKTLVRIKSSTTKNFFSSMSISTSVDGKLNIEMKPVDCCHFYKYVCKIFIRDGFGNKLKSGHGEFYDAKSQSILLTLPKDHLMENKEYYLPNDVLTMECEVIFPTGDIKEKIYEDYGFRHQDIQETISDGRKNSLSSKEHCLGSSTTVQNEIISFSSEEISFDTKGNLPVGQLMENDLLTGGMPVGCECLPEYGAVPESTQETIFNQKKISLFSEEDSTESCTTLKDDWASLFKEGILFDVALQTTTKIIPAHKTVLVARSPIFKAMFKTDMKERTNNCVEIEDVDADTVNRMLLFMYTDTLDDLEYDSAKRLYFAADKYNIVSLRRRCASFLKKNFLHSNFCDILLLADAHQDEDLKNDVQKYIEENDVAILLSAEWKNLEKNHSQLTTKVLHALYMKKRTN